MNDGDYRQEQRVHRQRSNPIVLFDPFEKTRKFTFCIAGGAIHILRTDSKQQCDPVTNKMETILKIKRLDITTREPTLKNCIPSISSDSRANDESVLAVPVDKIFRQSTDCRASSIRRDFIESVEQDAAASRFEHRFDVSSADLKVIRSESISDELYQ